jgi:chromatin remodeling complex protein RSC6
LRASPAQKYAVTARAKAMGPSSVQAKAEESINNKKRQKVKARKEEKDGIRDSEAQEGAKEEKDGAKAKVKEFMALRSSGSLSGLQGLIGLWPRAMPQLNRYSPSSHG